ncbi:hypothetical protein H6F75_27395 [Nodosilinea sp. FACHB-131]|uniref:hypothetical protein n=1 Tax=Cyanophyceae TaxID=3028117 RepID=UPI00168653D3|nr:hypothetical protein [Nodosilinea sp. FACHB-131]MBD1877213.1 hypothetical protein [Nodosilinea sp. FACHB-131]
MNEEFEIIQRDFMEKQSDLQKTADILSKTAEVKGRVAVISKVITIVLGAFIATQAVATQLYGKANQNVSVIYSVAGLLVATIGGVEAAFKNETKAGELSVLAVQCQSSIWQINTEWSKSVEIAKDEIKIQAAVSILERQSTTLVDIHSRAAQAGINIAFVIRELKLETWRDA